MLNLVVAKGYLKKLMENEAVRSYVARHAGEILEQFDLVLNTLSMEEAVEQAERQELGAAGQNDAEQDEQAGSTREGDGDDELVEQV